MEVRGSEEDTEMEEGGGEGEPVRDGRGVIQRREKTAGGRRCGRFGGDLKERFKEKLWSRIRAGWKKKEVFEECLRRRATATEPR